MSSKGWWRAKKRIGSPVALRHLLVDSMEKMEWQKHTVRGFMAGTMKKTGYSVESFKPQGGECTYRINS